MNEGRGNGIFLSVIGIATLLVAIVGATFAWFSVQVTGEANASTSLTTANLGTVTFSNGASVSVTNIYPGWEADDITFSIVGADTTEAIGYTITATVTGDSALANALTYSMTCTSTGSGTCAPTVSDAPTASTSYTGSLGEGTDTHTYVVSVSFPETNTDQNALQDKSYSVAFSVALSPEATKYTAGGDSKTSRTAWSN